MCSLSRDFFTVLALLIQKQLFDFYFTHFLFPGMFSLCWHSQSTQCLRVLPLDWRLQAAMSGQCLLPSLPTSTSFSSDCHILNSISSWKFIIFLLQILNFCTSSSPHISTILPSQGLWSPSASASSCCRPAPAQSDSASPSSLSPLSGELLNFSTNYL